MTGFNPVYVDFFSFCFSIGYKCLKKQF